VQLHVDEFMRGKVLAFYLMTFTAAIPLGSLLQGWTAQTFGPRETTFTAGLLLAVAVTALRSGGWLAAMDLDGVDLDPTSVTAVVSTGQDGVEPGGGPACSI
jgi:hypothetical protein